jgi:hypothetical protein
MKSKINKLSDGHIVWRTYCRSGHNVGMRQTIHILGWTDNMSILGRNVAVVNCRKDKVFLGQTMQVKLLRRSIEGGGIIKASIIT